MNEPMSSIRSSRRRRALAGWESAASARCGLPIGSPALTRVAIACFVELDPELAQVLGHAQGALLAVGEEALERGPEGRVGVIHEVAEDVQFARHPAAAAAVVDRGDLDRGDHRHPVLRAGQQRLGHSRERVVVGERQQLHARRARRWPRPPPARAPRRSGSSATAGQSAVSPRWWARARGEAYAIGAWRYAARGAQPSGRVSLTRKPPAPVSHASRWKSSCGSTNGVTRSATIRRSTRTAA